MEGLGQTYLSMDVDGRVVRLDSFSKFLLPGMRLGWVTAHPDMLQKVCFALHASTMGPCSYTQVRPPFLLPHCTCHSTLYTLQHYTVHTTQHVFICSCLSQADVLLS